MIENPKIAALLPDGPLFRRWIPANVHGLSLLYVPPGRSTALRGAHRVLHCDLEDPRLALYSALSLAARNLDSVLEDLFPCWLEPATYHSTFADSLNDFNLGEIEPGHASELGRFLHALPASLNSPRPRGAPPARVVLDRPWRVRFRFSGLHVWHGSCALVALLEPADEESRAALDELYRARESFTRELAELGLSRAESPAPHVTLCYFATQADARHAEARIAGSDAARELAAGLRNLTIEHGSIGLYGWTSMVEFWPCRLFGEWADTGAYAAQSAIVRGALADPDHALDGLLRLMRNNGQAALYLFGARQDHEFCLGSADVGALLSVLPEDGAKAAVPGYHPGSTEIYVTFQGQLTMGCLVPGGEGVVSQTADRDHVLILPPGRCHRVQGASSAVAASLIVKTNLAHRPEVVRCGDCGHFADPSECALHNEWRAETF
jgi:hypothetical protein